MPQEDGDVLHWATRVFPTPLSTNTSSSLGFNEHGDATESFFHAPELDRHAIKITHTLATTRGRKTGGNRAFQAVAMTQPGAGSPAAGRLGAERGGPRQHKRDR